MRISGVTYTVRKTHKARNTMIIVLLLIFLAIITILAISAYSSWKLLHPEKKEIEAFSENIVPEYRDINFTGQDKGIVLNGWYFEAKGSDKTIVLAHSYGRNRLQFEKKTIEMIKEFLNKGYNVFTFDFRNSGKSGGKLASLGYYEKDDLLGAISYLRTQGTRHITLMGFSTGASACILAASESNAAAKDKDHPPVDAVIADSPYADLEEYLRDDLNIWTHLPAFPFNRSTLLSLEIMAGMDTSNVSPEEASTGMAPARLLLIHGVKDPMIPVDESRRLFAKYNQLKPGSAELWETESGANAESYLEAPEQYMDKVLGFLDTVYSK